MACTKLPLNQGGVGVIAKTVLFSLPDYILGDDGKYHRGDPTDIQVCLPWSEPTLCLNFSTSILPESYDKDYYENPRLHPKNKHVKIFELSDITELIRDNKIALPSGHSVIPYPPTDDANEPGSMGIAIADSSGNIVYPCWFGPSSPEPPPTNPGGGDTGGGSSGGSSGGVAGGNEVISEDPIYDEFPVDDTNEDDLIEARLSEITQPSDLTLFEFSLLASDYINSYAIPDNVQKVVENSFPNIFLDQSKRTPLPLSSHPYDAGSMYQLFRTPKFDNIACIMEDTISQPFNSFHFYFNSNVKNIEKFGGIDNSSPGSSHRTKVIVNSNISGYQVPRSKDGTGYVTNNSNNAGIHVYTADNFYMTVDKEIHAVSNNNGFLKFGKSLNVLVGVRKGKPSYGTIPRDFYDNNEKFKPPQTETNIEIQNNFNILSRLNDYTRITSSSSFHFRVTKEKYLKNKTFNGEPNIEKFKNVDNLKDRCDQDELKCWYNGVSDEIHVVAKGLVRTSFKGIASSVSLPIEVNGAFTARTYKGDINLVTLNGNNIGITTRRGGDIVFNSNYQGGIGLKTHDGDIVSNTEHKGSIYNIVDCDGNIDSIINNEGYMNLKTYKGEINIESRFKGNVNIKARTGDIDIRTTLLGDIRQETRNGRMDFYTFHDENMAHVNTDINLLSHDGNINIFARHDVKCPIINIKSKNSIFLDAPNVYIRYGNLIVDGTIKACKIDADEVFCKGARICPPTIIG